MSKKAGGARQPRQSKPPIPSLLMIGGIVLIGVAVLIVAWVLLTPKGGAGSPQVQVSTERLELGKQIFDRPVRASFTVKNTGGGTLTLNAPRVATVLEGC